MSYTALHQIDKNGDVIGYHEYRNAHGGAAFIWSAICKKYLGSSKFWIMNYENINDLWKLFGDEKVTEYDRIVLGFTYDNVYVAKRNLPRLIESFINFNTEYNTDNNIVCHLPDWINDIKKLNRNCLGVCLHATSVSEDIWSIYEPPENEDLNDGIYRSYNINTDKKHWELFAEFKKN